MNSFITKNGVEVKVSQIWRDLDKRVGSRRVKVVRLGTLSFDGKVRIVSFTRDGRECGPERWLTVARMHRHSTGFELCQ